MDSITTFATKFAGGARAYLFRVEITEISGDVPYFAKSTSMPGSDIDEITVNWLGAEWKVAGGVKFHDWTVSFNEDRNIGIRSSLETWRKKIVDLGVDGDASFQYGEPTASGYLKSVNLFLLGYSGDSVKDIVLENAWPKSIGDASLDYGSQDILTFDVTFSYMYHTISDSVPAQTTQPELP